MNFRSSGEKHGNVKTRTKDGLFDSKHELRVWEELQLRKRAGEVRELRRQVTYQIEVNGLKVCRYIADFVFEERKRGEVEWVTVVADAKGHRTDVYRLKKKLMKACLGIDLREYLP